MNRWGPYLGGPRGTIERRNAHIQLIVDGKEPIPKRMTNTFARKLRLELNRKSSRRWVKGGQVEGDIWLIQEIIDRNGAMWRTVVCHKYGQGPTAQVQPTYHYWQHPLV